MKVRNIALDDAEQPVNITVEMTLAEVVLIAEYVGHLAPTTPTSSAIWDALTNGVLDRFWEDGLTDARREVSR